MIEMELISRFGEPITLWVRDTTTPVLEDAQGRPVIDFGDLFPQPYSFQQPANTALFKYFLDAFLMRPSPGLYSQWLHLPGTPLHQKYFREFSTALYLITGKFLQKATLHER